MHGVDVRHSINPYFVRSGSLMAGASAHCGVGIVSM